jgi:hypothetical protein
MIWNGNIMLDDIHEPGHQLATGPRFSALELEHLSGKENGAILALLCPNLQY